MPVNKKKYQDLYKELEILLDQKPLDSKTFEDISKVQKNVQPLSTTVQTNKMASATKLRSSVYATRDEGVIFDDFLTSPATEKAAFATKLRSSVYATRNNDAISDDSLIPSATEISRTEKLTQGSSYITPAKLSGKKYEQIPPTSQANWIVLSMCDMNTLERKLSNFDGTCATTLLWSGTAGNNTPLSLFDGHHPGYPFSFGFTLDHTQCDILFGAKKDFMSIRNKDPGHDVKKHGSRIRHEVYGDEKNRYLMLIESKYGYIFCLQQQLPTQLEQGKIYIQQDQQDMHNLNYTFIDSKNQIKTGVIRINSNATYTQERLNYNRLFLLGQIIQQQNNIIQNNEKKGCVTREGGGGGDESYEYYTDLSRWEYSERDIVANDTREKGILDGGTFHDSSSWNRFAKNIWRKWHKHPDKPNHSYNEALIKATNITQCPINGIIIQIDLIEKIKDQDILGLIKILKEHPNFKLFIYDKHLKEHIVREIDNTLAINLLKNKQLLTKEYIASLPPYSQRSLDTRSHTRKYF